MEMREKEKMESRHLKEWLLLSAAVTFMLCLFAPLETYYSNKGEFWFSVWQLLGVAGLMFVFVLIAAVLMSLLLSRLKLSVYLYAFLSCLSLYLYIQGNYIPRDYGVLNGMDIDWSAYAGYGWASIVVAMLCLALLVFAVWKLKEHVFRCGRYLSIFLFAVQALTILMLGVKDSVDSSGKEKESVQMVVTDNKQFDLSADRNIVVFILDTFDAYILNDLLDEEYGIYAGILEDFTYYKDTLGAYPTTKAALPYILTGEWYENRQTYSEYVDSAYTDNAIYAAMQENGYSNGIYASIGIDSDANRFENVEKGSYRVANVLGFAAQLYRMVAFNYVPHQWKQYFFYHTDEFSDLKKVSSEYQSYSGDVIDFNSKLIEEGIRVSEEKKCFRIYHLRGVHAPYQFGKELISEKDKEYSIYDEAKGNFTLLKNYFDEVKSKGIYDNTTIVLMADHGVINYSQNPIFLVKNVGERHEFQISETAMSYEYLSDIWIALAHGEPINENFVKDCMGTERKRRFLYYTWDDSWGRSYLPTMHEMFAEGVASEPKNLFFSGVQYEVGSEDLTYSLGTELSFAIPGDTAQNYCTYGFGGHGENGTWTIRDRAVMEFDLVEKRFQNLMLTLYCEAYRSSQEAILYVNDKKVADLWFGGDTKKNIVIPGEYVADGKVKITMEFPDAISVDGRDADSPVAYKPALLMKSLNLEATDMAFELDSQILGNYKLGTPLFFMKSDDSARIYCVNGFSSTEDWGTWTEGKVAEMKFLFGSGDYGDMELEYTCGALGTQHVVLYANGVKIDEYTQTEAETRKVLIPSEYIEDRIVLRIELPDAISPKELGINEDIRVLGLSMTEMKISMLPS